MKKRRLAVLRASRSSATSYPHGFNCCDRTEKLERVMGIEPTRPAWKAGVLPLNYTRVFWDADYYNTASRFRQAFFRGRRKIQAASRQRTMRISMQALSALVTASLGRTVPS